MLGLGGSPGYMKICDNIFCRGVGGGLGSGPAGEREGERGPSLETIFER